MNEVYIGFVGYSDVKDQATENAMRAAIDDIFSLIEKRYKCIINIVSGCTNVGISRYVYERAQGDNYRLIGVMAKEGYQYDVYPCDIIYAIGEHFGDESSFFINMIDELYKIGGGEQSKKEFSMAQEKGIPCYDVNLEVIK